MLPMAARLEKFFGKTGVRPEKVVRFAGDSLQKWMTVGYVDFLELFCGEGVLTLTVSEAGFKTGEGIDSRWSSYGQRWNLREPAARLQLAWLVAFGIQPLAVHSGTPCEEHSQAGAKVMQPGTEQLLAVVGDVLLHQQHQGYLGSNEQPDGSLMCSRDVWTRRFGPVDSPEWPWAYYRADGCQLGVVTPDREAPGQPHRKTQKLMANSDLGPFALRCQATPALVPSSHEHQHIRGS